MAVLWQIIHCSITTAYPILEWEFEFTVSHVWRVCQWPDERTPQLVSRDPAVPDHRHLFGSLRFYSPFYRLRDTFGLVFFPSKKWKKLIEKPEITFEWLIFVRVGTVLFKFTHKRLCESIFTCTNHGKLWASLIPLKGDLPVAPKLTRS